MFSSTNSSWLHRFAVLTALATLGLIGIGGLVTSKDAGMSVPDWPTSYGYNMLALPIHFWKGGIFWEHLHRLWASTVGLLVVILARWLGGHAARRPLAIIGFAEVAAGLGIFLLWPNLKGTGHFLTGIGGVVLLAALVWVRNEPSEPLFRRLGWLVFWLVQFQGLLGGLRVVLFKDELGIFHATLAQIFFVLTCSVALLTSLRWKQWAGSIPAIPSWLRLFLVGTTALILFQLILGAVMRHQHAGLAISDFPLAHGKLWPPTDPDSILRYNQQRAEISAANPITAFQVQLQMLHRIVAVLILFAVVVCFGSALRRAGWRNPMTKGAAAWLGLIVCQAILGAATVLTYKAADIATAHVLFGALSLATGSLLCIVFARSPQFERNAIVLSNACDGREAACAGSVVTP